MIKQPLALLAGLLGLAFVQGCDYINPDDIREGSRVLVSKWDMDTTFLEKDSVLRVVEPATLRQ